VVGGLLEYVSAKRGDEETGKLRDRRERKDTTRKMAQDHKSMKCLWK